MPPQDELLLTPEGRARVVRDFSAIWGKEVEIEHEFVSPPYDARSLMASYLAHPDGAVVAVLFRPRFVKAHPPAPPGRVLKITRMATRYSAGRFSGKHGKVRGARSTLALRLLERPILYEYLGIAQGGLSEATVEAWITSNTVRVHFYPRGAQPGLLRALETYLKGVFGPVFDTWVDP